MPDGLVNNTLRVAPDLLPPGSVRITEVWIDGEPHDGFDASALTVQVPTTAHRPLVTRATVPRREVRNPTYDQSG